MVDLLTKVTYTRVHGRFIVAEGANTDPDADPDDVIPQSGTVTFTPLVEAVQFAASSPPVTVSMRPVVCELDAQGYLVDSNAKRGVWLVSTDDADALPNPWGYKVREDFAGVKTPRIYTIAVPAGADIDLASAAPAPGSIGGGGSDGGATSSLIVVSGGTVDLDNTKPDGYLIGYKVTATTTIEGVSFAAGSYIFERDSGVSGGWTKRTIAAGVAFSTSDAVAPTAGTLAGSAITDTTFTLTVTGASDAVGLHASPYSFSTDNGATWSAYQSSAVYNAAGKTASTAYQCRHRVKDAAGNVSTGTAITVTTTAAVLPSVTENFNRTDGTTLNGLTTTTGGATMISPARSVNAGDNATNATTVGNKVTVPGGTSNEGRSIAILTSQQDYEASFDYGFATASSAFQARIAVRAAVPDDTTNASNSVILVVKGDGTIGWESSGVSGTQSLGSGAPMTGNLKLRCVGTTVSAFIDGVQVGSSWTQSKTGGYAVAGVYNIGSSMDNFKVQNL